MTEHFDIALKVGMGIAFVSFCTIAYGKGWVWGNSSQIIHHHHYKKPRSKGHSIEWYAS
jgi:hypothetical protein